MSYKSRHAFFPSSAASADVTSKEAEDRETKHGAGEMAELPPTKKIKMECKHNIMYSNNNVAPIVQKLPSIP